MRWRALAVLLCFSQLCLADDYIINVTESTTTSKQRDAFEGVLTLVYAPLNITPRFVYYPSGRGLSLVNRGQVDAEGGRSEHVAKHYFNLIKVPEPLGLIRSGLFCLEARHCELKSGMHVARQKGFESAEVFCSEFDLQCDSMGDPKHLAKLLSSGMVAALLMPVYEAPDTLCLLETDTVYYKHITEFDTYSYHYVHKSHFDIVDGIAASIRDIKQSGMMGNPDAWKQILNTCRKTLQTL